MMWRMSRSRFVGRIGLVIAMLGTAVAGCSARRDATPGPARAGSGRDKVKLLLDWYPEAEHGGYYAALVHGIYEQHGLDVEIVPGGRTSAVAPELVLGRAQFGVGNADGVILARSEESPLVALMAPLQVGPRCIMVRKDSGIESFAGLKEMKLEAQAGQPDIEFLRRGGFLDASVQVVPYFGSVAQLVAGPGTAQQGYSFSEPFLAAQEGVPVNVLMLSELGWNPYGCCLLSSDTYVAAHGDVARRMVAASIAGWRRYLQDPAETNAFILGRNQQGMTREALDFGAEALKPLCLPEGMAEADLGIMTSDRWMSLYEQLVALELVDRAKVKPEECFRWPLAP